MDSRLPCRLVSHVLPLECHHSLAAPFAVHFRERSQLIMTRLTTLLVRFWPIAGTEMATTDAENPAWPSILAVSDHRRGRVARPT